jgi:hypothetical protein
MTGFGRDKGCIHKFINFISPAKPSVSSKRRKEDMSRSKKGQAEHDGEVRRVANEYLRKGYTVLADLPGWEQRDTIKGVRPDLRVRKRGHETLIEVETPESEESRRDEKQKKIFKQWSERSQQRHFRRVIAEE